MATKRKVTDAIVHANDKSFYKAVGRGKLPVLVDFSAEWCGPCQRLGKVLPAIAEKFAGRVKVVKIDVDESPQAATLCEVEGIPRLVLFKAGRAVAVEVGFGTRASLEAWLEKALKAAEKPAKPKPRRPKGC